MYWVVALEIMLRHHPISPGVEPQPCVDNAIVQRNTEPVAIGQEHDQVGCRATPARWQHPLADHDPLKIRGPMNPVITVLLEIRSRSSSLIRPIFRPAVRKRFTSRNCCPEVRFSASSFRTTWLPFGPRSISTFSAGTLANSLNRDR